MTTPPRLQAHERPLSRLPDAIWMPARRGGALPSCYRGSPLEMVQQMAAEMGEHLGVHDAIDLLLRFLADERGLKIRLPEQAPEGARALMFVGALVALRIAKEMPKA